MEYVIGKGMVSIPDSKQNASSNHQNHVNLNMRFFKLLKGLEIVEPPNNVCFSPQNDS